MYKDDKGDGLHILLYDEVNDQRQTRVAFPVKQSMCMYIYTQRPLFLIDAFIRCMTLRGLITYSLSYSLFFTSVFCECSVEPRP